MSDFTNAVIGWLLRHPWRKSPDCLGKLNNFQSCWVGRYFLCFVKHCWQQMCDYLGLLVNLAMIYIIALVIRSFRMVVNTRCEPLHCEVVKNSQTLQTCLRFQFAKPATRSGSLTAAASGTRNLLFLGGFLSCFYWFKQPQQNTQHKVLWWDKWWNTRARHGHNWVEMNPLSVSGSEEKV